MPDISKCLNSTCPLNKECYRFMCKPSQKQQYDNFRYDNRLGCDYHMKLLPQWKMKYEEN